MWARIVELFFGCWLSVSPFIFRHPAEETFLWMNDLACAGLIALFALLSFWKPLEKIHLLTFLVACWMVGVCFSPLLPIDSPALQNQLVLGLLLLILSLIPSHSELPPKNWREFL